VGGGRGEVGQLLLPLLQGRRPRDPVGGGERGVRELQGRRRRRPRAPGGAAARRGGGEERRRPRVRALPPWPASRGGEGLAAGGGGASGEEQAKECRALLAPAQWRSGGVRETGRGCGKRDASWAFKWAFSHSSHFMSTDILFFLLF